MDAGLLEKLLGKNREWSSACVVVLDAEATVRSPGPDTILGGGIKSYAPRFGSGRVEADTCCLVKESNALLMVRQETHRDGTGQEFIKQTLLIADLNHVSAVEFTHLGILKNLGIAMPFIPEDTEYRPGTLVG
jgi:hypothetical protein